MNTTFTKRSGFSMIELVFVIVILGVLAAVAVPRFVATRTDAQIATARSDMASAQKAIVAKVFADNIDSTQSKAPDPNRKAAGQTYTAMTWGEWIMEVAGLDGARWGIWIVNNGDQLANETNPNFGTKNQGWAKCELPDAVSPIGNVTKNVNGGTAGRGFCGPVLGISVSTGTMVFNPGNAAMPYLNSGPLYKSGAGSNNFCFGLSQSYESSNGSGNKVVPLASTGTIEF